MRFGIMEMQLGLLVPPGVRPEQAMQHIAQFKHADLVRRVAARGFKLIELNGDLPMFFPQAFSPEQVQELLAVKQELGLTYTVHLPLWSVEPSTPQEPVRQGSAQALIQVIKATGPLDPEMYAVHATGALAAEFYRMNLPEMVRALVLKQLQSKAQSTLQDVIAETGISPRRLAIETIEFPFDLTLQLAEMLGVSVTLDTGHVLAGFSGPFDFFDVVNRVLPRLGEVHLHDSPLCPADRPGFGKDHQRLGTGDLDLRRLLDTLAQARYEGPIILELGIEDALASLDTILAFSPLAPNPRSP